MKKLLISAAAAALAGATASASAVNKPNYDASFTAPQTLQKSSSKASLPNRIQVAAPSGFKPTVKARHKLLSNEFDARLGVTTFLWAEGPQQSAPLAPLKSAKRAEALSRQFLAQNSAKMGLSKSSVNQARLIDRHDTGRGPVITRLQQTHDGLDVFGRQINVMLDRDLKPVAASGYFAPQTSSTPKASFDLSPQGAIAAAFADLGGKVSASSLQQKQSVSSAAKGGYTEFAAPQLSGAMVLKGSPRAKQVYFPQGDRLIPAWYLEMDGADAAGAFGYSYVVAADSGKVLFRKNLVENEAFTYRTWAEADGTNAPLDSPLGNDYPTTPLESLDPSFAPPRTGVTSTLLTVDHGPISTGDPWLTADATETVGNNVDAYIDLFGQPGEDPRFTSGNYDPELGDYRADITAPLTFDYDFTAYGNPLTVEARKHAIVNLFYVNNWMHDWWYDHGFDEQAGNAQFDNYGRGGAGGDPIQAQAQDWSGRNNANMRTPSDGASPTMQMYLFDGTATLGLDVTSPDLGSFDIGTASFGPTNFSISGDLVITTPANACTDITSDVVGKIAVIDRGTCSFQSKAARAQSAGAIGVIIVNNASGAAPGLGIDPAAPAVSIPTVSVSQADGGTIKTSIGGGTVTASVQIPTPSDFDGTLDNAIVAHEFFHYVSNRLVSNAAGLGNNQGRSMGEGWSDVNALLLNVRESDAAIAGNENFGGAYASASYTQLSAYFGIRRAPYSVNPAVFPMTFQHIENGVPLPAAAPLAYGQDGADNAEVHASGEIWANTLFTFYVSLLNDPRYSFTDAQNRFKDYIIAGLKMTPFAPTFLEARDAILAAAKATDQTDFEHAAKAFAKMGMGVGAVAPDRLDDTHSGVVESYLALAGAFVVSDVQLDFAFENGELGYHDLDGVLDAGETAEVTLSIHSSGTLDLTDPITVTLSSDGDTSFPEGATVTFPPVDADGNSSASFLVTLNSAATADDLVLTLTFPPVGDTEDAVVEPDAVELQLAVNYDVGPNLREVDDVEVPLASEADWPAAFLSGGGDQWGIVDGDSLFGTGLGWYVPDNGVPSDAVLTSPAMEVGEGDFSFGFDHFFLFEVAGVEDGVLYSYDGGILEISVDGAPWQDVTAAGGSFTENGYNSVVFAFDTPREGFGYLSDEDFLMMHTEVDFGAALAGKSVRFRLRAASDANTGDFGWFVDNFTPTGAATAVFSDVIEDGAADNANRPPHATVPADFSVAERTGGSTMQATVTLNGSATDLDGTAGLTYQWVQTAGPAVTLVNANTATASFTAPVIEAPTALTFRFTVNDGEASDAASVTVTVTPVQTPAAIGISPMQEVFNGKPVTVTASATDPDGGVAGYQWSLVSGPDDISLSGASTTAASFTPDKAGTYVLRVTVTDAEGDTTTADTQVRVKNPIDGGGSFGWLLALGGLLAAGMRRKRLH